MALLNISSAGNTSHLYPGAVHLQQFHSWYKQYHGYLATAVCIVGIVANLLNIVVLTRKNMISSTNCILTGLAVSDGLTMAVYLPFALWFYVLNGTEATPQRNNLSAVRFMLFYAVSSVLVHTASIWLTVVLAVFRFIFIRFPYRAGLCSLARAKLSVLLTYFGTVLVCVPNLVTLTTVEDGKDVWIVAFRLDSAVSRFLHDFNFWVQAIVVKLVPCVGLTLLSCLLVHLMRRANRRGRELTGAAAGARSPRGLQGGGIPALKLDRAAKQDRKTQKTTAMLLVIVLLFLVTEFPQGVLSILSGLLPDFVNEIYVPLGDVIDILTLVNNGINFLLYCAMSKQFRDTFLTIFRLRRTAHA